MVFIGSGSDHCHCVYFIWCLLLYSGEWHIPRDYPQVSDVTESTAVVTWKTIQGLPDDIKQYYKYMLEYREQRHLNRDFVTFDHNPDASNSQQATLTGLRYGQDYIVDVKSVRTVRGLTDETRHTPTVVFTTKCPGRSVVVYISIATDGSVISGQNVDEVGLSACCLM